MRLFIDIETNAVGNFRPPTQYPMQIACILSDDTGNEVIERRSTLVSGATKINKKFQNIFTLEEVNREGIVPEEAVEMVLRGIDPENTMIIAHNLDFDLGILLNHANSEQKDKLRRMSTYDTMKMGTSMCKLPNSSGYSKYKYPNLEELAYHFGVSTKDKQLHNSEVDTEIMRKCFVKMI